MKVKVFRGQNRQEELSPAERMNKFWAWVDSVRDPPRETVNYSVTLVGNTLNCDQDFIRRLNETLPGLVKTSVEESDVILVFSPIVKRAGTDVEAALQKLKAVSDSKPAVLVVLHHTNDPDLTVPDNSRAVTREKTLTVDCLFHEDRGLLRCQRNQEALDKVTEWIKFLLKKLDRSEQAPYRPSSAQRARDRENRELRAEVEKLNREIKEKDKELDTYRSQELMENEVVKLIEDSLMNVETGERNKTLVKSDEKLKYSLMVEGKALNSDQDFIKSLSERLPGLEETSEEESDVILLFCPVVSRPKTDIEAALQKLQHLPATDSKPAVLVVLYHTVFPDCTVPDSSRRVTREETLTVDCLFHEDRGLLTCQRNQEALDKVTEWIKHQVKKQDQLQSCLCRLGIVSDLKVVLMEDPEFGKSKAGNTTQVREEESQPGPSTETQRTEKEQKEVDGETGTDAYDWTTIQHVHNRFKRRDQQLLKENIPESERQQHLGEIKRLYQEQVEEIRRVYGTETDQIMIVLPELEQVIWVPKSRIQKMLRNKTALISEDQKTGQPEGQKTGQPEGQKTGQQEGQKTGQPEGQKTGQQEGQKTGQPEEKKTGQQEGQKTGQQEGQKTGQPEEKKTRQQEEKKTGQQEGQKTGQPEEKKTGQPEEKKTGQPEGQKTGQPEGQKTGQPEGQKTGQQEGQKTGQPEGQKTGQQEGQKTGQPEGQKTGQQEGQKTGQPEEKKTGQQEGQKTGQQEGQKTGQPEEKKTRQQEGQKTGQPDEKKTGQQEGQKTGQPDEKKTGQPDEKNNPVKKTN